jgi:outer membrane protein assembly factor BamB
VTAETDRDDGYAEDRPASRMRMVLVAALVVLTLMLAGLGYFIVRVVTPAGAPTAAKDLPQGLEWVRSIYGYGQAEGQQFKRPVDVAIGPDGSIWATDPQRNRVLGFNADGSFKGLIHTGPSAKGAAKMGMPEGVAVGEDGNVYVADTGNEKIMVFTQDNRFIREWAVPSPLVLAVRNGRVVVGSGPGVSVHTTDGKLLSVWGKYGNGPEEFNTVHGVAIAANGTVYISDTNNVRIKAYKADGTLLWIWPKDRTVAASTGVAPKSGKTPVALPAGMTLDGQGRLVVADPFSFELVVLDVSEATATVVSRYGAFGSKDGFFAYETGVSYDPARDVFAVTDTNNDRVQIVRLPGSAVPGVAAAAQRALTGVSPWCLVPVILLLLAVIVAVLRRRGQRRSALAEELDEEALEDSTE